MKLAAEPGEDAQAQALDAVTAYTQTFNKILSAAKARAFQDKVCEVIIGK